ncbi:outer dense fiber protein 3-like isoform X2 [Chrysoperla carnea]|uniref:outer dense fiber protein 3-like isoform X2 n=1 Tax=Chrysoperla carnea TaxID=189513 RepID=UPI001D08B8E2|nr:outer dense fiber protein 3-like isoform X2 [Chrysoperla carnea]
MGGFTQRQWVPTKRRGPIAAESASPGPAFVALPSLIGTKNVPQSKLNRAPAFSFGNRHSDKDDTTGPGPAQYDVTGLSAKGKSTAPSLSIHSRNKEMSSFTTPAPGDYAPEKSVKALLDSSPKYTIGLRPSLEKHGDTPAPNVYTIPSTIGGCKEGNKRAAPSYTITGRHKDVPDERVKNPGAGSYDPTDGFIKQRAPAFTISQRYEPPRDLSGKPGPGEYAPEKVVLDYPPAHSFGIKHSPYSWNY